MLNHVSEPNSFCDRIGRIVVPALGAGTCDAEAVTKCSTRIRIAAALFARLMFCLRIGSSLVASAIIHPCNKCHNN